MYSSIEILNFILIFFGSSSKQLVYWMQIFEFIAMIYIINTQRGRLVEEITYETLNENSLGKVYFRPTFWILFQSRKEMNQRLKDGKSNQQHIKFTKDELSLRQSLRIDLIFILLWHTVAYFGPMISYRNRESFRLLYVNLYAFEMSYLMFLFFWLWFAMKKYHLNEFEKANKVLLSFFFVGFASIVLCSITHSHFVPDTLTN